VVTANQQSQSAFADVNAMLREQQLDRAASQPTLSEDVFFSALSAEDLAVWHRAFASIEAYAGKLELLLSPDRRTQVEGELRKFGADIEQRYASANGEKLPPGIAAGFVKLGGLLVQLKAGQDAMVIIRDVNPAVQDIFSNMAEAIGTRDTDGNLEGIRGTVWTSWSQELGKLSVAFQDAEFEHKRRIVEQYLKEIGERDAYDKANIAEQRRIVNERYIAMPGELVAYDITDIAKKRRIAEQYLDMLGERDAHDRALASVRASIIALSAAHNQLAQGDRVSSAGLIRIIQEEYQALRDEIVAMNAAREAAGGGR
jgi:hypothetical protein